MPALLGPLRIFLYSFLAALAALVAIRLAIAPPALLAFPLRAWTSPSHDQLANDARVLRSRPAFKAVERYDAQHRYRPAASPVIDEIGPDGTPRARGRYY